MHPSGLIFDPAPFLRVLRWDLSIQAAIVAPLLATVLEQLSNGGGAKSVTVESVGEEIEELGRQYPIAIPPYFGLIIRYYLGDDRLRLVLLSRT